jgi:hypothetical protein
MSKRHYVIIALLLILAVASAPFTAVVAQTALRARADPTLVVVTIPEDDEKRKTGIMFFADSLENFTDPQYSDFLAQFKILVTYNGAAISPSVVTCQVIQKDKYNVIKQKQGDWENLVTVPKDDSGLFACKVRWAKPGEGVLDVYWVGPAQTSGVTNIGAFISDYVLVVSASTTLGRSVIQGTDMQDICVLGWPELDTYYTITWTDPLGKEQEMRVYQNPLNDYASCEDVALLQKKDLEMPMPWM